MDQSVPPAHLQTGYSAATPLDQITALKAIKNDISGHEARKEVYIRHGLLPLLAQLLSSRSSRSAEEADALHIHIADIIGILARGGPRFVSCILSTNVVSHLLKLLSPHRSTRVALAVLRCVNAVADNLPPFAPGEWSPDRRLANLLYSAEFIGCFSNAIEHDSTDLASQQMCDSVISLLCKTCTEEKQKRALVRAGCLSALAGRFARFIVSEGLVLPDMEAFAMGTPDRRQLPSPVPATAHLSPVLEALSLLVENSKERAQTLLKDSTLATVLPPIHDEFSPSEIRKAPWGTNYFSGTAVPRSRTDLPIELLIPHVPYYERHRSAHQVGFPPLGSVGLIPKRRTSFLPGMPDIPGLASSENNEEAGESPLIPLLLWMVRRHRAKRHLLALRLLVIFYNLNLVRRSRMLSFGALLVPLVIRMLDKDKVDVERLGQGKDLLYQNQLHFSKMSPAVLALLVMDEPELQKVAVDMKAIGKLAALLKTTFDAPTDRRANLWKARKEAQEQRAVATSDNALGVDGPSLADRQVMVFREGILQALAAIAPFNDDYRREICDQGALAQIMRALEPFQQSSISPLNTVVPSHAVGNSASTLLAACGAIRVLTRSVTTLRTKLVDAEVAKAVLKLMSNRDSEVRIAATKVVANLALDFSPMKDAIGDVNVVKKLCEQAHSANASLRFESIWALKQLVLNAKYALKRSVIDELGPSWIKHLIQTNPSDIPPGEIIGLVEKEYPPRLRTRGKSVDADVIMSDESDEGSLSAKLDDSDTNMHETDDDYNRHTIEHDTMIQEQLLDLIRNLFCGEDASRIIEYVFKEMGQEDFFTIMLDRLRSRTVPGATRKENHTMSAPRTVVANVLFVLSHVAAGSSRHRSIIAANDALLRQIQQLFAHSDREIRAQCCWIVINLTYEDAPSERMQCRHRAGLLRSAGYLTQIVRLQNDVDLDVRERARTALHLLQMSTS